MAFSHRFDPTSLREYDIRGIVGQTLTAEDAFAIGRTFGSIVARADGKTVAVGYDGRLSSPELEAALVRGLMASGMEVLRIGRGPTPMLYYTATTQETDGAVMVTGSHNPPNYNGFKMMIGRKPFFGPQIKELGRLSEAGDVVPEAEGLFYPKQQCIIAARAAGILPLGFLGTVADYKDLDAFRATIRRSRRLGFLGASCIHPSNVPILNEEFAPTAEEVSHAERMVAAYDEALAAGRGSIEFEGKMIDIASIRIVNNVVERANLIGM
ncbi:MAG: hypothetical protein J0H57_04955 [Rhodospirillales bacterium]|nr:hypothetical protein [Rhodospirillales bacterium]